MADTGGRLGENHYFLSSARGRGKGREGRGRGGRRNYKDGEEEQQKVASSRAGGGKADREKGGSAKCKRCGETGHKSVRCPDQICCVCGGKGHSAEVCVNAVTVLACENTKSPNDESEAAISDEEAEIFVCDMSGECNDESNHEWGCSALAWQVGNLTVICDSGASCHVSLINRNDELLRVERLHADGKRCEIPVEGYGDLPLTFRSSSGNVPLLLRNVAHVPRG